MFNTYPAPDLAFTKTRAGSFAQGDTGKVYTITVTNAGTAPTNGFVTATDTLPGGLRASGIGRGQWGHAFDPWFSTGSDSCFGCPSRRA